MIDMNAMLSDDMDLIDGLETITYTPRASATPVLVENVLRRNITYNEIKKSNGDIQSSDVRFHAKLSLINLPQLGDMIEDGIATYTILNIRRDTLNTRWRFVCRDLAIAENLNTIAHIILITFAESVTGFDEPIYSYYKKNVRAKLTKTDSSKETEDGQVRQDGMKTLTLELTEELKPNKHIIEDVAGNFYRIQSSMNIDELGKLPSYECDLTEISTQII